MTSDRLEVLLRAADAGDTFMYWTWLRSPWAPQVSRRRAAQLDDALAQLESALMLAEHQGDRADPSAPPKALTEGPFSDYEREYELARAVTEAVLPNEFIDQIVREARTQQLRIRLTPSPRLSRVPWETLLLRDGRRLIEAAEIVIDPPSSLYADRSRRPEGWAGVAGRPVLHVVDPALRDSKGQLLGTGARGRFTDRVAMLRASRRMLADDWIEPFPRSEVTRESLSSALLVDRSRLFYFGHISSDPDEPGTAALHLSDAPDTWGLAKPVAGNRPLSALDFLLGTTLCDDPNEWDRYNSDTKQLGHQIWPMPCRVALVACEGSVDFRSVETFGLVIAILDSGAELVTTTRWPLPADAAYHHAGLPECVLPTTELALRVDTAHEHADPVGELRRWQLSQLHSWRNSETSDVRFSPILWAALTHTHAPRRED